MRRERPQRTVKQFLLDLVGGVAFGAFFGVLLVLWVEAIRFVFGDRPVEGIDTRTLYAAYLSSWSTAGAIWALIRPWLHTLLGQSGFCFVATFTFYSSVSAAHDASVLGTPIQDGLIIAVVATPIWVALGRYDGFFEELAEGVGEGEGDQA